MTHNHDVTCSSCSHPSGTEISRRQVGTMTEVMYHCGSCGSTYVRYV